MVEMLTLRFTVDGWKPADLAGIEGDWLGAVVMHKTYVEGLSGESVAHFISSGDEDHGRGYLAAERITGKLADGRSGAFTVHHGALNSPDDESAFAYIVPGTGTDDFADFRGSGRIIHDDRGPYFELTVG
jgi:Protein of unknown function (DUF3224)